MATRAPRARDPATTRPSNTPPTSWWSPAGAEFGPLLLRSTSEAHPRGLANGSDLVGRNYMRHNMSVVAALLKEPNDTVFQKDIGDQRLLFRRARLGIFLLA